MNRKGICTRIGQEEIYIKNKQERTRMKIEWKRMCTRMTKKEQEKGMYKRWRERIYRVNGMNEYVQEEMNVYKE